MAPTLSTIRCCLEGGLPATVATCSPEGVPNVSYASQVHYVDEQHVALTFQFFNTTRRNVLANPRALATVIDPDTAGQYRLDLEYVRTESRGPLFESMKAKLAGIASHTGMSGVFRLRGSDVYRVRSITAVPGDPLPAPPPGRNLLAALRAVTDGLTPCTDLAGLLARTLDGIETELDIQQAMILFLDAGGRKLYTVASRGYDASGVGSEIPLGQGVIGVAAEQRTPIRIMYATSDYAYGHAVRDSLLREGLERELETEISLPGLPDSRSQLAVPITACGRLLGALFVESASDLRFDYDHEDALVTLAGHLGAAILTIERSADEEEVRPAAKGPAVSGGVPCTVRHYAADDSIFIDSDYLIKGVAGAIFRKLLTEHAESQRVEFCNKELRLDASLRLPGVTDNLEARLILLERRLAERHAPMRLQKSGRGRFRLHVDRPFELVEIEG